MVGSDPDFTAVADELDFETLQIAPPPSPIKILFRIRLEAARVNEAIIALDQSDKTLPAVAVKALICAIAEVPYPGDEYEDEVSKAAQRLYLPADNVDGARPVDGKLASKYGPRAIIVLRLASQVLASAEEATTALYSANQVVVPKSADNLTTIDLARRITEQATVYFRSRIG